MYLMYLCCKKNVMQVCIAFAAVNYVLNNSITRNSDFSLEYNLSSNDAITVEDEDN